jgi:outer membrane lipoprotein-sorting protein
MKQRVLFTIMMAVFAITTSYTQDPQELLDKYFETIGQENLLKVKTLHAKGKAMQMGMEFPFEMMNKRPDKLKTVVEVQGSQIIQVHDGESVWAINPMSGSSEPIDVTGPEADALIENADMDGQLWNWKEKGHQLELEGTEEVDDIEMYVLKLTKKNGNIDHYYLDPESYLVPKMKSKVIMEGSEMEVEVIMSNFQEVNGYIMPFTVEQRMNGQSLVTIMFDEVKMDTEMDDAVFAR